MTYENVEKGFGISGCPTINYTLREKSSEGFPTFDVYVFNKEYTEKVAPPGHNISKKHYVKVRLGEKPRENEK